MNVAEFLRELRRRRVFRVIAAYALVGWGLLQLGEIVFPALNLPDWSLTLLVVLLAFGFPVAILLAWAFDLNRTGIVRADAASPAKREGSDPSPDASSVAVLPFENLSAEAENEYFSDGISEDLITKLCSIGALRVISRASSWQYRSRAMGAREIASELGVAFLVGGSVRRSRDQVRIAAHLIDARSDRQVWAETYDRRLEDVFAIQTEVASRIVTALRRELDWSGSGTVEPALPSPDVEAYDEYLRGRFHWNRRTPADLATCVAHFRAAIRLDPDFVRAHAALGEAYVTLATYGIQAAEEVLPAARREAKEALRRQADQPSALSALAAVRAMYDWDWAAAEQAFEAAMTAHPQYPTAPQWYAMTVLVPLGRFAEASAQLDRAHGVDPKSSAIAASRGVVDFMRRDYRAARERFDALVARSPDFAFGHYFRGLCALYLDEADTATDILRLADSVSGGSVEVVAALGCALARAGKTVEAESVLGSLVDSERFAYVSPVRTGQLRAALDDEAGALADLDRARETRAADLVWIDVFPGFDPVRDHPRFHALRDHVFGSSRRIADPTTTDR